MRVITIQEENHGYIGIAKTYADAVHMLVNQDWLSELTEVYKEGFEDTVTVIEDLGENWFQVILHWTMQEFGLYFDGCFYLDSEEVYEVA